MRIYWWENERYTNKLLFLPCHPSPNAVVNLHRWSQSHTITYRFNHFTLALIFAPLLKSNRRIPSKPLKAAICNAIRPSASLLSTSAPAANNKLTARSSPTSTAACKAVWPPWSRISRSVLCLRSSWMTALCLAWIARWSGVRPKRSRTKMSEFRLRRSWTVECLPFSAAIWRAVLPLWVSERKTWGPCGKDWRDWMR